MATNDIQYINNKLLDIIVLDDLPFAILDQIVSAICTWHLGSYHVGPCRIAECWAPQWSYLDPGDDLCDNLELVLKLCLSMGRK